MAPGGHQAAVAGTQGSCLCPAAPCPWAPGVVPFSRDLQLLFVESRAYISRVSLHQKQLTRAGSLSLRSRSFTDQRLNASCSSLPPLHRLVSSTEQDPALCQVRCLYAQDAQKRSLEARKPDRPRTRASPLKLTGVVTWGERVWQRNLMAKGAGHAHARWKPSSVTLCSVSVSVFPEACV